MPLSREEAQRIMDNANEPIWLRQDAAAILAAYQRQADEQAAAARAQQIAALKRRIAELEGEPQPILLDKIRAGIAAPLEARIAALETLTTPAAISRALAEYSRLYGGGS